MKKIFLILLLFCSSFTFGQTGTTPVFNLWLKNVMLALDGDTLIAPFSDSTYRYMNARNAVDSFDVVNFRQLINTIGDVSASDVSIALGGGSPIVDQLQEYLDNTGSSGFFLGGELSDGGAGTLDAAAGEGFIRATNDDNAAILSFKWSASAGIAVPDNTTQYVYVTYPGTISLSTDEFLEAPNKIQIGVVTDEGGSVQHTFALGVRLQESIGSAGRFLRRALGIQRDNRLGGLNLGQSGDANRYVTMTSGALLWGRTEYPISAFNTSGADRFQTYSASGQEDATASSWDNTQYDNSGTLTTMTNNRWSYHDVYLEPDEHIVFIYGRAQYNTEAVARSAPRASGSLPSKVTETAKYIGRFIFEKSSNTATITSAFTDMNELAGVTDHPGLANLAWTSAGHTGTLSTLAGFDGAGAASEYTLSGTGTVIPTTTVTGAKADTADINYIYDDWVNIGGISGTFDALGTTWADLGQQFSQSWVFGFAYCDNGIVVAGTNPGGKILRSIDYGKTWRDMGLPTDSVISEILAVEYLGDGVIVGGQTYHGRIFRSDDYGLTWTDLGPQISGIGGVYAFTSIGDSIALAGTNKDGGILRSDDKGLTWASVSAGASIIRGITYMGGGIVVAVDQTNAHIFRSTDYGLTWTDLGQQGTEAEFRSVTNLGNGIALAGSGNNAHIFRTVDYGLTWTDLGQQFSETSIRSITYLGGGVALAGTFLNGKILKSTDYGLTWIDLPNVPSIGGVIRGISYLGNGILLAGTGDQGHILRSTDFGDNFDSFITENGNIVQRDTTKNILLRGSLTAPIGIFDSILVNNNIGVNVVWADSVHANWFGGSDVLFGETGSKLIINMDSVVLSTPQPIKNGSNAIINSNTLYDADYSTNTTTSNLSTRITNDSTGLVNEIIARLAAESNLSTRITSDSTNLKDNYSTTSSIGSAYVPLVTMTDNAIFRANLTTGIYQNSGVLIDDSDNITGIAALTTGDIIKIEKANDQQFKLVSTTANVSARNWAITSNYTDWGTFEIWKSNAQGGEPVTSGSPMLSINLSGAVAFNSLYGTAGQVLQSNGSLAIPTWVNPVTGMTYLGGWNASTNTPTISDVGGSNGDTYAITVTAARDLGSGSVTWTAGNFAIHNGSIFQEIGTDAAVSSVNGLTSAVILYPELSGNLINIRGDATTIDISGATAVTANTAKLTANTANVTAAGALMDSEVDSDLKTFALPASTTISAFGKALVGTATLTSNSVLTGNSASTIVAESNLTFDGSTLTVTGAASTAGNVKSQGTIGAYNDDSGYEGVWMDYTFSNNTTDSWITFNIADSDVNGFRLRADASDGEFQIHRDYFDGGTLTQKVMAINNLTGLTTWYNSVAFNAGLTGTTGGFSGAVTVLDNAYNPSWNGSTKATTENAVFDKFESLITSATFTDVTINGTFTMTSGFAYYSTGNPTATTSSTTPVLTKTVNKVTVPVGLYSVVLPPAVAGLRIIIANTSGVDLKVIVSAGDILDDGNTQFVISGNRSTEVIAIDGTTWINPEQAY